MYTTNSKTTAPNGGVTNFTYDTRERINKISSTVSETENKNDITYVRDEVDQTTASNNSAIKYEYEIKRRVSKITVDGETYQTFAYEDKVSESDTSDYLVDKTEKTNAKGEKVTAVEEIHGNFAKVYYNDTLQLSQIFNKDGTVSKVEDNVTGEVYDYEYDELGNVTEFSTTKNGAVQRTETVTYDNYGNVSQKSVTGGNTVTYAYKDNAERDLESVTNSEWFSSIPSTDKLKRNTGKTVKDGNTAVYTSSISYRTNTVDGVVHATTMPQTVNLNGETFTYEYDSLGNIYQIKKGDVVYNRYLYDSVNRLIREDNRELNKSTAFSYDSNGNIISKQKTAFTLGEVTEWTTENTYGYTRDKLTSFNGNSIVYDSVGNPTSFKGVSLTWEKGKRLIGYGTNTFAYDGQGRRIRKNTTTYSYDSENRLVSTSDGLKFYYDQDGIAGFTYQNAKYVYQKDAQNNIVGIVDNTGAVVVKYIYDAWGVHTVSGSLATTVGAVNPFRYRSYFYDVETGLYYLKTRYYDPEICRFISMDSIEYADHETINGLNLYAYCDNNPVMGYDPDGTWNWKNFWKGVATVAITVAMTAAVVASAGAVGAIVGVGAASIGLSTTAVSTAVTVATVSTYVVAGSVGVFGASDAIESFSGGKVNPIRDYVMGGNQEAYNITRSVVNTLGSIAITMGAVGSKALQKIAQHGGSPKVSNGTTVGYSRDFFDKQGNWNFRIDATTHGNTKVPWHHNPHYHVKDRGGKGIAIYYLWEIIKNWF